MMARLLPISNSLLRCNSSRSVAVASLSRCKATTTAVCHLSTAPFPVLEDPIVATCPQLVAAAQVAEEQLAKLAMLTEICKQGGGPKAQEAYARKKVLPRDRIARLLDDPADGMLEIGTLAGLGMPYGDVPGAGIIAVIGKVHGRWCLVSANDGTLKGGTYFPIGVRKQLHASDLAMRCGLPLIILVDSGGGFLPLQAQLFPDKLDGGRMFYTEAVYGAQGLPSVAVVCGSCTAGGAYAPSMCEESAIVDKIGTLFLGGPPLVKAALGEDVNAEDLGGATLHSSVSGVTDYFLADEEEGFAVLRDSIATTNILAPPAAPTWPVHDPLYPADTLDALSGRDSLDRPAMMAIIARLVDGSRFREFKQRYGRNLAVGYGCVAGQVVGVVANWGALSYQDGMKGSHFLQICQHRQLPVLFLQNSGPPAARQEWQGAAEQCGAVRGRAAMAATVACLTTTKVAINVAGCVEDDNHTMCGPGFDATFSLSWPSGFVQYTYCNQSTERIAADTEEPVPSGKKKKSQFEFVVGSCWYNASNALTDAVIAPHDTRAIVIKCLDISGQKARLQFTPKQFPVFRF